MVRTVALATVFCLLALHNALAQSDLHPQFELIGSFGSYQMTVPRAINDARQVAGYVTHSGTPSGFSAFLWSRRDGFHLLLQDAVATDINNRGDVVGWRFECVQEPWGSSCASKGFIWNERTGFRDLGEFSPNAVNENGDMAGTCVNEERGHIVPCALHDGVVRFGSAKSRKSRAEARRLESTRLATS